METQRKALRREAPRVWHVPNAIFFSNCYICETGEPGRCLLIDPGLDPEPIDTALLALGLIPIAIFCTHGHFDHAGSARHFQETYGCPVYMHEADKKTLKASNFLLMAFKIPVRIELPMTTISPDPCMKIGKLSIRVHHTPGHTPGSCIFEIETALFTGDTLYASGVGLSRLPGEDPLTLQRSIDRMSNILPYDATVYPGHGHSATLGSIIEGNEDLRNFLETPAHHKAS